LCATQKAAREYRAGFPERNLGNTGPQKACQNIFDKLSDRRVQFCEALGLVRSNSADVDQEKMTLERVRHYASSIMPPVRTGERQAIELAILIILNAAGAILWMPWAGLLFAFDPTFSSQAREQITFVFCVIENPSARTSRFCARKTFREMAWALR